MKKIYTMMLVAAMSVGVLAGCTKKEVPKEDPKPPVEENEEESEGIVKAGLGIITSTEKSKDKEEEGAAAQVDTTMAAVGFDKDGKIVSVSIDVAQSKIAFDKDMQLTTNLEEKGLTKKELKEEYNMKGVSEIGKEWYEQIASLEEWMIGKTVGEVKAMKVFERDENHKEVPDEEDLKSTVTITVESYIAAVEKAWENAIDVENGFVLGLGQEISYAKSKSQTEDKGAFAQVDNTISALVLDEEGKVAEVIIDTAQTKVSYDLEGKLVPAEGEPKTKKELGDEYGMRGASEIEKEWFEQIAALEDWSIGKTPDEVAGMELAEDVPTAEDLTSTVTIKVGGYLSAMKEASENTK